MAEEAIWITEAEVVSLMDLPEAIDALEAGLRRQAAGEAQNMGKTHASWANGSTLHAVGATFEGLGYIGTKTWAHTAGGATPLLILWDAESGALAAVIEAFALGQMRTGGISGVATRWLADPGADRFAILGTGKQALAQVAAVAAVRPLAEVRVFSPTPEKRAMFVDKVRDGGFAGNVVDAASAEAALDGASIVTVATRARQPFVNAAMLAPAAHVNAIGAITPERAELDQSVFERANRVVADDPGAGRRLSSEFRDRFGDHDEAWSRVEALADVVAAGRARSAADDLTIFKAMGMGLSDLSLGIPLLAAARSTGLGRSIPTPVRAAPRLRRQS